MHKLQTYNIIITLQALTKIGMFSKEHCVWNAFCIERQLSIEPITKTWEFGFLTANLRQMQLALMIKCQLKLTLEIAIDTFWWQNNVN